MVSIKNLIYNKLNPISLSDRTLRYGRRKTGSIPVWDIYEDFIMDKTIFKKTGEELQEFLKFRKRGSKVKAKKGKGSFSRKQKHKNKICGSSV